MDPAESKQVPAQEPQVKVARAAFGHKRFAYLLFGLGGKQQSWQGVGSQITPDSEENKSPQKHVPAGGRRQGQPANFFVRSADYCWAKVMAASGEPLVRSGELLAKKEGSAVLRRGQAGCRGGA